MVIIYLQIGWKENSNVGTEGGGEGKGKKEKYLAKSPPVAHSLTYINKQFKTLETFRLETMDIDEGKLGFFFFSFCLPPHSVLQLASFFLYVCKYT